MMATPEPSRSYSIQWWYCPVCKTAYRTSSEAEHCCQWEKAR